MAENEIEKRHHQTFEEIKRVTEGNSECWSARDLQPVLEYNSWDKFKKVVEKAMTACEKAGQSVANHFSRVGKMVPLGSGAEREVEDFFLSRYACYLIVQNGDPSKLVIAKPDEGIQQLERKQQKKLNGINGKA
jgi:DNA-damage-inducible protein D